MSRTLLGRASTSDRERIALYAAILALGSDLTPADTERVVADVSAKPGAAVPYKNGRRLCRMAES